MKIIFLFLLTCCLSKSVLSQSKDTIDLVGTWQTIDEKDTIRMTFNGASFRFDLPPDNPFSKLDFIYHIEKKGDYYILNYHVEEVSTSYTMKLWVINHEKIKCQVYEFIAKDGIKQQLGDSAENSGILVRIKNN